MIRTRRVAVTLSILFAVALSMIGPAGNAQPEPVDIHAILSLTGPAAFLGKGEQASALAFEKSINAAGGINGRPVRVVIQDDQSQTSVARQLADALVAQHVPVIVGPSLSAMALALQPDADNGLVVYALTNAINPPKGSSMFSASVSIYESIIGLFRYLKGKGVRKLATLTSTDASGTLGEQQAVEVLKLPEFKDMQLVAQERFAPADLSVAAQMERIKAAGAEAIDAWTTGTSFATVLRAAHDAAYPGSIVTNTGNMLPAQLKQYTSFLPDKLYFVTTAFLGMQLTDPALRRARENFLAAMKADGVAAPDQANLIAWDPFVIVADALKHVGPNASGAKVRDYIDQIHGFPGVQGMYDFRAVPQRGLGAEATIVARWDPSIGDFVAVSRPGGQPL